MEDLDEYSKTANYIYGLTAVMIIVCIVAFVIVCKDMPFANIFVLAFALMIGVGLACSLCFMHDRAQKEEEQTLNKSKPVNMQVIPSNATTFSVLLA